MEAQEYALEIMVREKLDEARAAAAWRALAARARPSRPPLRARLGALLIGFGNRLAGESAPHRSGASPSTIHG